MQRKRFAGFSVSTMHVGAAQSSATTPAGGGTVLPLVLFTLGGLAVLAGVAHLKEKLK